MFLLHLFAIRGGSGGSGIGLRGIRINGEILLDGLNNTGVNSFYLPFDGNSPIGKINRVL